MVFHKIDEKVVSSWLLQYKPVCVINFDKLCRKMQKKKNFSRRFSIAILRKSPSCVTSYQDAFVSFAFYYDSLRSYVTVYVLRTYFYVYRYAYVLLRDRLSTLNTQLGCLVVFSWYDIITCEK